MAIPRTDTRSQISLDTGVYGSLPAEGFPEPPDNDDAQMLFWHKDTYGAGQWVYARIQSGTGINVDYDPDTGIITFSNTDYVVASSVTADAYLAGRILADAVLLATIASSFTGDSTIKKTASATYTADATLV